MSHSDSLLILGERKTSYVMVMCLKLKGDFHLIWLFIQRLLFYSKVIRLIHYNWDMLSRTCTFVVSTDFALCTYGYVVVSITNDGVCHSTWIHLSHIPSRSNTSGQAFPQCVFDHWEMMLDDPYQGEKEGETKFSKSCKLGKLCYTYNYSVDIYSVPWLWLLL